MSAKRKHPAASRTEANQIEVFRKLYWAARKAHQKTTPQASAKDPAHQLALEFALEHGWTWGVRILDALLLAYRKDEIKALQCLSEIEVPPAFLGDLWFMRGNAEYGVARWDQAVKFYQKAINTPGYDALGWAWLNMGLAHSEKGDLDPAIECYREALSASDFEAPGAAWISMGVAYLEKREFGQAIDCFNSAVNTPGFDSPGVAWGNLGVVYYKMKDFGRAIDYYRQALEAPNYHSPHLSRLNLSNSLRASGRLLEAEQEIRRVLSEPDTEGEHSRAEFLLSLVEADLRGIETNPEDEALASPIPAHLVGQPEGRMWETLLTKKTQYEKYLKASQAEHPDELSILRGWSSSVTLLEGAEDCQWSGGGYFLKWQGKGLVIDPGFDFLDNFHQAGFHATEIAAVVVSHNHPDHNADLKSLDDLCYEIFRVAKELPPFLFAMDEDTADRFPNDSPKHRGSPCKLTLADHERSRWLAREGDLPFTIEHFPMKHGPDVPRAMGLRFRLHMPDGGKDLVIGYTGDGEFTDAMVEHLQGVDVLIAHVSQPEVDEFKDSKHPKKIHLGYNGVIKLVKALQPRLILVGEFWAGLADLRLDLIAGIRLRSGVDAVLPACLGLSLSLPDLTIRCTRCRQQVAAGRIKVAPPIREFGLLGYLCPECIL